jgi:hypothetical protein
VVRAVTRVLVTGSRSWPSRSEVVEALDQVAEGCWAEGGILTVVHGACWIGADRMAAEWCRKLPDVVEERHPAVWAEGKGAGFARNKAMVELGADVVLAFIHNGSGGATDCADLAERAGLTVVRFERTGLGKTVISQPRTGIQKIDRDER